MKSFEKEGFKEANAGSNREGLRGGSANKDKNALHGASASENKNALHGANVAVDEEVLHEARVAEAVKKMPKDAEIELMGARFKCLSEPSRLKILFALSGGELCVDHIVEVVGGTQSAVSHQLKTLRDNRIIKCRRDGKKMLYSVSDSHIMIMAEVAKEHLGCDE